MEVNEKFIKLSSRIPTNSDFSLGQDVDVVLAGRNFTANCVKIEELDNQDGTKDLCFIFKWMGE